MEESKIKTKGYLAKYLKVASKFAMGSALGVITGYILTNALVSVEGTPVWIATAMGYFLGFFFNFTLQIRNKVVKI